MPSLKVQLNGTDHNPWLKFGVTQNPFPQIARTETAALCIRLQALGGNPIPHDRAAEYIREKLAGFSDELIELCIQNFRPGEYTIFTVEFPD